MRTDKFHRKYVSEPSFFFFFHASLLLYGVYVFRCIAYVGPILWFSQQKHKWASMPLNLLLLYCPVSTYSSKHFTKKVIIVNFPTGEKHKERKKALLPSLFLSLDKNKF